MLDLSRHRTGRPAINHTHCLCKGCQCLLKRRAGPHLADLYYVSHWQGQPSFHLQSWSPAKQAELLQSMPGSTAAEVTLQLLLQSSHKWVYKGPVRAQPRPTSTALLLQHETAAGLEGIAEDDVSGAAEVLGPPDSFPDEVLDEEYDEEEV